MLAIAFVKHFFFVASSVRRIAHVLSTRHTQQASLCQW